MSTNFYNKNKGKSQYTYQNHNHQKINKVKPKYIFYSKYKWGKPSYSTIGSVFSSVIPLELEFRCSNMYDKESHEMGLHTTNVKLQI